MQGATNSSGLVPFNSYNSYNTEASGGVESIQREMAFRMSLGYGLGVMSYMALGQLYKLGHDLYKALPTIGLPTVDAEPAPVFDITL